MVLVFGTICLDRVRRVPHMPAAGGYVEITSEDVLLGGEAANTALALRAWGVDVILAGNGLGHDPRLKDALRSKGLNPIQGHLVDPGATPVCDVYVSADGERTMIGQGFSEMNKTVDPSKLPFRAGAWFTAEPNMNETAREAVRLAHKAGMRIYTMDFACPTDPIFPGTYWQSSTDWTGERGNPRANLDWIENWIGRNGCFAILTDGPNGFAAGSPDLTPRLYPPYPARDVVDATGSGDVFRAGMIYGLERGWPSADCLRFASAAGCLACQSLGATSYVPSVAEIESLIAESPDVSLLYG